MEIIISPARVAAHKVEPYSFKKVNSDGYVEGEEKVKVVPKEIAVIEEPEPVINQNSIYSQSEDTPSQQVPNVEVPATSNAAPQSTSTDSTVVQDSSANVSELYKKIDEMSSSVIKMEMRLEKQQEEFNEKIEEERERSLAEGIEKGRAEAEQTMGNELKKRLEQLAQSINKVENAANGYENTLKSLEKELTSVALDIAKEVIAKEVEEDSADVAKSLASKLLEEVKDASETTIRGNPTDIEELKNHLSNNPKIKIESDSAISPGGVIIMSNVGNINGDIHKRYEQVRKNTLDND